ncbi:MAG TPA: hypothetical protein VHG30_04135 [Microvirga sp.]|nr:hypothetical protein [Microvirga sp.]
MRELPPDHWIVRTLEFSMGLPIVALGTTVLSELIHQNGAYRAAALSLSVVAAVVGTVLAALTLWVKGRPKSD